ncbi:hypothetical protein LTR53_013203, partial [Teratosphaeriaceae sp. CCFEE 6253]
MRRGLPRLRLRDLNPLRLLNRSRFAYQRLPNSHSPFALDYSPQWPVRERWRNRIPRLSTVKLVAMALAAVLMLGILGGGVRHQVRKHRHNEKPGDGAPPFYWLNYHRLNGYYNGVRTLVPAAQYEPENGYNRSLPLTQSQNFTALPREPPLKPVRYSPYPDFASPEYLREHEAVHMCHLDVEERIPAPEVYAYPGVPQHMPQPLFGSHAELGLEEDVCFERFGRFGPYGYGYNSSDGGLGLGNKSERAGSEEVFKQVGYVDYRAVDWGAAQRRCHDKNRRRFEGTEEGGKKKLPRQAYVLRTWTGYEYTPSQILTLRAMITELSLQSGGEYDVHFLVHVKNNSLPIWASPALHNATLHAALPAEFHGLATLWSEAQMRLYYPPPFPPNAVHMAGSSLHGVYRSAHFALQWFAQQHPEYEFVWNWEMDVRFTGHYWAFHSRVGEWARRQPRKGLWERGARFWVPRVHGDYANFTAFVERQTAEVDAPANDARRSGPVPVWGPVQPSPPSSGPLTPSPALLNATIPPHSYEQDNYTWGAAEPADLIVFNPLFDPSRTNWVFRDDVTGYALPPHSPPPPRRAAIITVARFSRRLLATMHEEVWENKHTMFPEMFPASVCLHHGLKAVYAPHPVYFDRDWDPG